MIVELHVSLREENCTLRRTLDAGTEVTILREKVLGILGFGGIGTSVARMAHGFGMRVYAYSRRAKAVKGVKIFDGEDGLSSVLRECIAVVLAVPVTNQTTRVIKRE